MAVRKSPDSEYHIRIHVGRSVYYPRYLGIWSRKGEGPPTALHVSKQQVVTALTNLAEQTIILSDARRKKDLGFERGTKHHISFENGDWKVDGVSMREGGHSPGTFASRHIDFSILSPDTKPPKSA